MRNKENFWTKEKVDFLIENYKTYSLNELSKIFNKSKLAVANKASKMYLTKPLTPIINYNIDELKIIASKFKSKVEFKTKNWKAYKWASNNNLLDEICDYEKSYSIPQLVLREILETVLGEKCIYNSRKIINPYEIDIYFEKWNLAFEYNGKGWHNENKNDIIKENLCKNNNIHLITIIENNRKYEKDIKKQLIDNLTNINIITNLNISNDMINNAIIDIYDLIPTKINLKEEILKYKSYKELKKENIKLYRKLKSIKKIDLIYKLIPKV